MTRQMPCHIETMFQFNNYPLSLSNILCIFSSIVCCSSAPLLENDKCCFIVFIIEMCHDDKVIVLIEMRLDLLVMKWKMMGVLNIFCVWKQKVLP